MSDVLHSPETKPKVPLPALLDAAKIGLLTEFERALGESGYGDIRPTHGCVFRFVREDGMRLTDLAETAGITKQSAGEMVDGLAELGYVERIPDPEDRRAKLIRLTDRGVRAQTFGFGLFADLEARWTQRYGAERMEALRELLEEITAAEAPWAVPELARAQPAAA
jgi:DNA-binding MarR family transcriptional regulator